ncbi:MAG: TolC family protein [Nitrospirota bacterium]
MRGIRCSFVIVLSVVLLLAGVVSVPAGAQDPAPAVNGTNAAGGATAGGVLREGELLTLEQCVAIALRSHPAIAAAGSSVEAVRSRIGQAAASYYPQIDLSAGYDTSDFTSRSGSRTIVGRNSEFSGTAALRQNLYDFGRTSTQVRIQRFTFDASRMDLKDVTDQIVLNVRESYYGVLRADRNREVAREVVKQFGQHLEQAKGFFEVGLKPKFDVTKAEVDLSTARLDQIRAENSYRIAWVTLRNAMGIPTAPEFRVEDSLSFAKYDISLDSAVARAYANRPDLQSTLFQGRAAEQSVELARKGYYPTVSGSASYSASGERTPLDDGWSVGAVVSFPLFNGFLTRSQVDEARATLDVVRANEQSLRQLILLEIQQAYLNLNEAEERIGAAELTVRQARENLDIATGRYDAGVGDPIEVTDALIAFRNAETAYNGALYDYKVAQANIERAMGGGK